MTYNSRFLIAIEYEDSVLDILEHMLPMLDIVHLLKIYFQVLLNIYHLNMLDRNILDRSIYWKDLNRNSSFFFITFSKHDWNMFDWFVNEIHSLIIAGVIEQLFITGGTSGHLENAKNFEIFINNNQFLQFDLISIDYQNLLVLM